MAVNSYGIAPKCNGNDYQFRTARWMMKGPRERAFLVSLDIRLRVARRRSLLVQSRARFIRHLQVRGVIIG
jgi:hypothetical protein